MAGPGRGHRETISLFELHERFPNEESAAEWFVKQRWPNGVQCPHCDGCEVKTVPDAKPMPYWCKPCRKYFSVRTKTVMHRSKLPLRTWLFAIYLNATSLKGVSSLKLHRDLGISQPAAWFLNHRIREAFEAGDALLSGPIEIDEAYLGGTARNRPKHRRLTAVVGIRDRTTREIRATVIARPNQANLLQALAANVESDAMIYSDGNRAYRILPKHVAVRHSVAEYVAGEAHTNGIESFWAMLKRAFHGTFHHFSPKHMARYINEMATRQSWREFDTLTVLELITQRLIGKSLTYSALTAGGPAYP